MINKAKRLLVPYISIGLLWVVPIYCVFYKSAYINIAKRLLIGDYNAQLWYILMLFWLFVMIWPISDLIKKEKRIPLSVLSVGVYLLSLVLGRFIPYDFGIFAAMVHFPFFIMGFKIRQNRGLDRKIPVAVTVVYYVVIFVTKLIFCKWGGTGIFARALYQIIIFAARISGSFMAWRVLQWAGEKIRWNTKVFSFYLAGSMPVYLIHQQVVYCSLWLFNGINPVLHICLNFVLALGVSLLITSFMMKMRFARFLIGG